MSVKNAKKNAKFSCIDCNFITSNKYNYNIHITTPKHKAKANNKILLDLSQKSLLNSDNKNARPFTCEKCDYKTGCSYDYNKHLLTIKHKNMLEKTKNESITEKTYKCVCCKYSTNSKKDFIKHEETKKHIKLYEEFIKTNENKPIVTIIEHVLSPDIEPIQEHMIEPIIETVAELENKITIDMPMFIQLMKDNQELKKMLIEQNTKLIEISKTSQINNITNNTINAKINKFNMNVFLNEKCKDAMNIKEFIESIKITFPDLEFVGTHGFVNGITKILTDHLNKLDLYKRPIHCTDVKREVLHIKEEDQWLKDNINNEKTINMIEKVAHKNLKLIGPWQKDHPNSQILDTEDYTLWWNIAKQSNNGTENSQKNTTQILKNIAKTVYIDKDNLIESS